MAAELVSPALACRRPENTLSNDIAGSQRSVISKSPRLDTTRVGMNRRYSVVVWTLPEHRDMELLKQGWWESLGRLKLTHQLSAGRWRHFR